MKYETSKVNVNVNGKISRIMGLSEQMRNSLNKFNEAVDELGFWEMFEDDTSLEPFYSIVMIVAGECCEGDYIVVGDDLDNDQLTDKVLEVIANHGDALVEDEQKVRGIVKGYIEKNVFIIKDVEWRC